MYISKRVTLHGLTHEPKEKKTQNSGYLVTAGIGLGALLLSLVIS